MLEAVSQTVDDVMDEVTEAVSEELFCFPSAATGSRMKRRPRRVGAAEDDSKHPENGNQTSRKFRLRLGIGLLFWCWLQRTLNQESCDKSWLERSRVGLTWMAGAYCGPANGLDFSIAPKDPLDAMCAQHDFCIEHSHYDGKRLYPKGSVDKQTGEARCGIPLRAWQRDPEAWGRIIAKCDQQLVDSVVSGFQCDDLALPRSPFCDESFGLLGGKACSIYSLWKPLGWLCRLTAWGTRAFESRKIRRIKRTLALIGAPAKPCLRGSRVSVMSNRGNRNDNERGGLL